MDKRPRRLAGVERRAYDAVAMPDASPAARSKPDFSAVDFDKAPFIVIWEVTQGCDLACVHCRAEARPWRDPLELSTEEAFRLIDQIREFGHPLFVLTGGDPLKRPDIFDIIRYADRKGLRVTLTPSATPLMTRERIQEMKEAGLARMAVSLDGHDAASHDAFRRVPGSFDWTLRCIRHARAIDLDVQVNTTVTRHNKAHVREIAALLAHEDICLWAVFFLVPVGRGKKDEMLDAAEHEEVFNLLYDLSKEVPFDIKTTAAQHYRRVVVQRRRREAHAAGGAPGAGRPMEPGGWASPDFLTDKARPAADASTEVGRSVKGINDGNGFVFISHHGDVCPSGFLPISGGNVRERSLVDIYRNAPLFRRIRDYTQLKGKCGWCDFRDICGGSRSRSYGVTGDIMASEPYCAYDPPPSARSAAGA